MTCSEKSSNPKYRITSHYVPPEPGWCSYPQTSVQLSLDDCPDHPIFKFIKRELIDPRMEHLLRRIAAEDGEVYKPNYFLAAVRPTLTDISILNHFGRANTLAWLVIGNDRKDILESIKLMVDWLDSGNFMIETKKLRKLKKKRRAIEKLKEKRETEKLNADEIAKLGREEEIDSELEDLFDRAPYFS